jgi:starch synthase
MRIVQAVFGVYHHFELALELEKRGHLEMVYSTWPWARLKREGVPRNKVETFPWIHTPHYLLGRTRFRPRWMTDELGWWNALAFDHWTDKKLARLPSGCDALIAISGAGMTSGRHLQERGGKFICDRGSTHARYQEELVRSEYELWGLDPPLCDMRAVLREEQIYATADAITVPSRFSRDSFIEKGILPDKIHVIPYGVRLENFKKSAEPDPNHFDVLFAGQVSLRKGFPYLLQAFAKLKHPSKRLRVAGSMSVDLRMVLHRLPQQGVEFLGSLPQPALASLMSRSHVLVLPAIEDGFGMVMNQAMACGCPVIATDHCGSLDLLTEGKDGFIVPIRDIEAILERMQRLADAPLLRQEMSEAALRRVRDIGGWKEYGDRWEALLLKLTGNLRS